MSNLFVFWVKQIFSPLKNMAEYLESWPWIHFTFQSGCNSFQNNKGQRFVAQHIRSTFLIAPQSGLRCLKCSPVSCCCIFPADRSSAHENSTPSRCLFHNIISKPQIIIHCYHGNEGLSWRLAWG